MNNLEKEFLELEWWAILDQNTISKNDFLLWNLEKDKLEDYLDNIKPETPKIFYNQAKLNRTRNACTLFWSFWAVSDLTGYNFSEKEILEICDIAEKYYGWREDYGWYIYKAVDCVRNYWNKKFPEKKLVSFRIDLKSEKDLEIIKKLYEARKTIVIWYRTTKEHYIDSQDNWVLDRDCFVSCGSKITGWHCIRYNFWMNIDNYIDRKKYNSYVNEKLVKLVKEWTYFISWYVFFYKDEFDEIFSDVQEWAPFYEAIKWAKENWIIHWYDDWTFRPNNSITRGETIWVLYNFNEYLKWLKK